MAKWPKPCPYCGGNGGWKDVILEDGTGPWEICGYCNGTCEVDKEAWVFAMQAMRELAAYTPKGEVST